MHASGLKDDVVFLTLKREIEQQTSDGWPEYPQSLGTFFLQRENDTSKVITRIC